MVLTTAVGFLTDTIPSAHGEILTISNEYLGSLGFLDSLHGYAYFSAYSNDYSHADILKIRLSDFTHVSTLALPSGIGTYPAILTSALIDLTNSFAYLGTSNGTVARINLSDFFTVDLLSLNLGQPCSYYCLGSSAIDPVQGFAYFVANTTVVKIRLSDFTQSSSLALVQESTVTSALMDSSAGFAYFGGSTYSRTQIVKVRLSDFTYNETLTLDSGPGPSPAVIDGTNGFAYFGTPYLGTSSSAQVIKIRLSDLSLVANLTLDSADGVPTEAVLDGAGGKAYFGSSNGKIVEVSLSDLARIRSLDFSGAGYNSYSKALVIDTTSRFAYLGGGDQRANIIKVNIDAQNQPPFAVIGGDPAIYPSVPLCNYFSCYAQRPIEFNASRSFDTDGYITEHSWSFGDGENAVGLAVNHTYTRSGTFIVTLRVTDNQGDVGSSTQTIEVHPLPPVRQGVQKGNYAKYAVSSNDTTLPFFPRLTETRSARLNVTNVSGANLTLEWADSLSNGKTLTFAQSADLLFPLTPPYSYPVAAPRTNLFLIRPDLRPGDPIWLNAQDLIPFGLTGTRQEFLLGDRRQIAFLNSTFLIGEGRIAVDWDQASGLLVHASAYFKNPYGPATVDEISLLETDIWQPNLRPTARFTWTTPTPSAGQPVVFDASSSADADGTVSSYLWDFGDGGTSTDPAPTHTFRSDTGGIFSVRLTVYDDDGANDTQIREIPVAARLERCGSVSPCLIQAKGRISDIKFTATTIHFVVTGDSGTTGFANVTIPRAAVPDVEQLKNSIFLKTEPGVRSRLPSSEVRLTSNSTHYFVYFPIAFHSSVTVEIELPQQIAWGLVFAGAGAAAVAVVAISSSFVYLRKMRRQNRIRQSPPPTTNQQDQNE